VGAVLFNSKIDLLYHDSLVVSLLSSTVQNKTVLALSRAVCNVASELVYPKKCVSAVIEAGERRAGVGSLFFIFKIVLALS
jgi:hypothetical protein